MESGAEKQKANQRNSKFTCGIDCIQNLLSVIRKVDRRKEEFFNLTNGKIGQLCISLCHLS